MAEEPSPRPWLAMFRPDYVSACDGSTGTPARHHGSDAAPRFTARRAVQNMVWLYAFGLIFLVFAVSTLTEDDPSSVLLAVRVVQVVIIALGYLGSAWVADCTLRTRWLYICGYAVFLALTWFSWGWSLVGYGIYVSIMMATLLPWRQSRVSIIVWSGLLAVTIPLGAGELAIYSTVISLGMGLATAAGMEAGQVQGRLQVAEQRVNTLSVAAERERIGRDLHDILGHSLTAISIKAGLAARLVDIDPTAAKAQIAEIEQISRQALADVRTTASGMREVRLATEIASARSVLLAAGIESRMPSALPTLPDQVSELFGYVVREGVTNVVRHSRAGVCTVTLGPSWIEVRDDGRGVAVEADGGCGLTGLRERLEAVGGSLTLTAGESGGTVLRADLSGAGGDQAASADRSASPSVVAP